MESRNSSGLGFLALVGILAALAFGGGVAVLLGREMVWILALVLTGAIAASLVLVATAVVVRAYRRNDAPPIERHTIERHTIDGRAIESPKLYQLPAQSAGAAYPHLLRAAWVAGQQESARLARQGEPVDVELQPWQPGRDLPQ